MKLGQQLGEHSVQQLSFASRKLIARRDKERRRTEIAERNRKLNKGQFIRYHREEDAA